MGKYIYIITPIIAWLVAQTIKVIIESTRDKKFKFSRWFVGNGGMPSSHSASVIALLVVIAKYNTIYSAIFGLALWFSIIVINDAICVRRETGRQAEAINDIYEDLKGKNDIEIELTLLKEQIGHSPKEVGAGVILGALIGYIMIVII